MNSQSKLKIFLFSFLIFIFLFWTGNSAQNKKEFKIGLALKGGGALGFAHIGAISVIDSLGIPIDFTAGSSMGALVGALYSIGYSAEEMEELVMNVDWNDIFNDTPPRGDLPFIIKKNTGKYQLKLELDALSPKLPSGLISGQKISTFFFDITYPFEGIKNFDCLPIPFRCTGSDLISGNEVLFKDGSLSAAMRSSMSIPTVFDPVRIDSLLLVDGGVLNNYPTDLVKNMGADFIIGLNLVSNPKGINYYTDLLKVLDRTSDLPRYLKLKNSIEIADLNINENIEGFSIQDFSPDLIRGIIARGKRAAYENLDTLLKIREKYFNSNPVTPHLSVIKNIKITGQVELSGKRICKILKLRKGDPFDEKKLNERISSFNKSTNFLDIEQVSYIQNDSAVVNLFVYEHFFPRVNKVSVMHGKQIDGNFILDNLGVKEGRRFYLSSLKRKISLLYGLDYFNVINYSIKQNGNKTIDLNISAREKLPHKFLFGLKYDDYYKLVGVIGVQINSLLLPGMYIESDFQFSGYTKFNFLASYPSRSLDFPIYPFISINYIDMPWDIYDNSGEKVMRYYEKEWSFAGGIGIDLFGSLNFSAGIKSHFPNIELDFASGVPSEDREINEHLLSYSGDLTFDVLDSRLMPRDGMLVEGNLEISSKQLGSSYDYTRLEANADIYKTLGDDHTFHIGGLYRRSWKFDPAYRTWFFIGGPKTFLGWDYHQGLGFNFLIFRGDYKINFFNNFFIGLHANGAAAYQFYFEKWLQRNKILWGYGLSLEYNSLMGPIKLFVARGDKSPYEPGQKSIRIYFEAGYNF